MGLVSVCVTNYQGLELLHAELHRTGRGVRAAAGASLYCVEQGAEGNRPAGRAHAPPAAVC